MRLHTAAYEGDAQTLAARAPPALDVPDAIGATPLIYAISGGERDAILALIRAGADLGAAADSGYTALMWAAAHPARTEYVALLLDAGADPSQTDSAGDTALDWAIANGHTAAIALLSDGDASLAESAPAPRSPASPERVRAQAGLAAALERSADKKAQLAAAKQRLAVLQASPTPQPAAAETAETPPGGSDSETSAMRRRVAMTRQFTQLRDEIHTPVAAEEGIPPEPGPTTERTPEPEPEPEPEAAQNESADDIAYGGLQAEDAHVEPDPETDALLAEYEAELDAEPDEEEGAGLQRTDSASLVAEAERLIATSSRQIEALQAKKQPEPELEPEPEADLVTKTAPSPEPEPEPEPDQTVKTMPEPEPEPEPGLGAALAAHRPRSPPTPTPSVSAGASLADFDAKLRELGARDTRLGVLVASLPPTPVQVRSRSASEPARR